MRNKGTTKHQKLASNGQNATVHTDAHASLTRVHVPFTRAHVTHTPRTTHARMPHIYTNLALGVPSVEVVHDHSGNEGLAKAGRQRHEHVLQQRFLHYGELIVALRVIGCRWRWKNNVSPQALSLFLEKIDAGVCVPCECKNK